MKRFRISSAPIFVQIMALVLLSLVAAQVVNLGVVLFLPDPPPLGYSIPEAARALEGRSIRTVQGQTLRARIQASPPGFAGAGTAETARHEPLRPLLTGLLARELGVPESRVRVQVRPLGVRVRHTIRSVEMRGIREPGERTRMFVTVSPDLRSGGDVLMRTPGAAQAIVFPPFAAAVQRPDGQWAVLEPTRPLLSSWQLRTLVWFGLSVLILTPLAWWLARRLTRPIHRFAEAAERLGADPDAPPLAPAGPAEVRTATAAFNDMQGKLRAYVQERTAMVAAIAHDLRTPLMRMRFRIEAAPEEVRDRVAADIDQMDAMVSQALAFVRGEAALGERVRLDLAALVQSVLDDLAEVGADTAFTGGAAVIEGDPVALRRLVTNLVENAVKFGGGARVGLRREGRFIEVIVSDEGPGLAESELERVLEPFRRADMSRSASSGGFGLGLSVARAIARAHGGDIVLRNRATGGLEATARLPGAF